MGKCDYNYRKMVYVYVMNSLRKVCVVEQSFDSFDVCLRQLQTVSCLREDKKMQFTVKNRRLFNIDVIYCFQLCVNNHLFV